MGGGGLLAEDVGLGWVTRVSSPVDLARFTFSAAGGCRLVVSSFRFTRTTPNPLRPPTAVDAPLVGGRGRATVSLCERESGWQQCSTAGPCPNRCCLLLLAGCLCELLCLVCFVLGDGELECQPFVLLLLLPSPLSVSPSVVLVEQPSHLVAVQAARWLERVVSLLPFLVLPLALLGQLLTERAEGVGCDAGRFGGGGDGLVDRPRTRWVAAAGA